MHRFLRKSSSEKQKTARGSKYATNWCNLPFEMRAECMKHMDFITRMRLRRTSHTEKILVESKKFSFDYVQIASLGPVGLSVKAGYPSGVISVETNQFADKEKGQKVARNAVFTILKHGDIQLLKVDRYADEAIMNDLIEALKPAAPFRFKQLFFEREFGNCASFLLENCQKGVELVNLGGTTNVSITDLLRNPRILPVMSNLKHLQSFSWGEAEIDNVAKMWIATDKKIGSKFVVNFVNEFYQQAFQDFQEQFEGFIISQTEKEIRILTNNPEKHILLKIYYRDRRLFVVCQVIPSSLTESDYDKEDGWISLYTALLYPCFPACRGTNHLCTRPVACTHTDKPKNRYQLISF